MAARPLTPKQRRFVEEYLVDCNATQAAVRAGYSDRNAGKIGPELLGKTRIGEAISRRMANRSERVQVESDEVLRKWALVARANIGDYLEYSNARGVRIKASSELTEDQLYCVAEASDLISAMGEKVGVKIKLKDSTRALEQIAKHLGMLVQKHQVAGDPNGEPIRTTGGLSDETVDTLKRVVLGINTDRGQA